MLMEDGGSKAIGNVRIGDCLLSRAADGAERAYRVSNIIGGVEDSFVHIQTEDGSQLRCTASHPVLTPEGLVRADRIAKGSLVACVEGGWQNVCLVATIAGGMAYSLELVAVDSCTALDLEDAMRDPRMFWANGILVGDLVAQAALERGYGPH